MSAILEVNAAPGFRMHPPRGLTKKWAAPVIDIIPPGKPSEHQLLLLPEPMEKQQQEG